MERRSILLFGTTRYSKPLSLSDANKFKELSSIASVNLLNYGYSDASYSECGVFIQNIKEPKILLFKYLKFYIFSIPKIKKLVKERGIEVIFAKDAFTGLPIVLSKKIYKEMRNIKLVVESHGDYREMVFKQRKYTLEKLYKTFVAKIGSFVVDNSDMIRGVSTESIEILTGEKNIKSTHFPAWVDNSIFYTNNKIQDNEKKDILYVGNIIPRKGVLFLLEAFNIFASKNIDSSFILIGNAPNTEYKNKCKDYVKKNKLEERVKFVGETSQEDIAKIMNQSKVLVLASSFEGLPRVLIESGLCSLPSIGPNIDGVTVPFGKSGGTEIYELNNTSEFLKILTNLYSDKDYYSKLAKKALYLSNKLSGTETFGINWSKMIKEVLE